MRQYVKISLGLLKPSGFSQAMLGLTLALVMLWSSAAAEEFAFSLPHLENIADAEVIPGGAVTALAQDVRGLIWIGTQKGLIRYDGYRFRRFVHAPADPTSLADDFVMSLLAAKDGKIWIGSNSNGLSVFDPSSEKFVHFRHDPAQTNGITSNKVWEMVSDAQGGIWAATDRGLNYLPGLGKPIRQYLHEPGNQASLLNNNVRSLLMDKSGRLWVGSSQGLQRLRDDAKGFDTIADMAKPVTGLNSSTEKIDVRALFEAQDGKLWLGTAKHGAAFFDPTRIGSKNGVASFALTWLDTQGKVWVNSIIQVQPQQIWLAVVGGGIHIVAASDGKSLQHLRHDPGLKNSLAIDEIKPFLLDDAGLLWIGTWGGGLQRFNTKNSMVRILRRGQTAAAGLSHSDVFSIAELSDGTLLFGTNGNGIDLIDRQRGLIGGYRATGLMAEKFDGILALVETKDHILWAGTKQAGVAQLLPGTNTWQTVPGLPGQQVRRFLLATNGSLWVATDRGVARKKAGQTQFEIMLDQYRKPMEKSTSSLAEDREGRIWAGTENGLWVMAADDAGFQGIHHDPLKADSLISDDISGLLADSRGRLWVATYKGLERMLGWDGKNAKDAKFEHINARFGSAEQALGENIMEDRQGRIWTDAAVIDPEKMHMALLTKADGIEIGTGWVGAFEQTRDGLLMLGGTEGVAIIDPNLYQPWRYVPRLVVTALKINGQAVAPGALALPHSQADNIGLTLNASQRNFTLEFAALDYSAPKKNRYQYRLQGYENDWIDTDFEHRNVTYGNLSPGNYVLRVRGSNRTGEWSQHELAIPIKVLPAYWQTWWFFCLALLIIASMVHVAYRWRTTRLTSLIAERTADILKLGKIGQELTSTLDTEQAFERVYEQIRSRLDVTVFSIGIYDEKAAHITFVYEIENGHRLPSISISMSEHNRVAVWCVRERRELVVANRAGLQAYVDTILAPVVGETMETVVYLPLMIEQRVIGCLSVQSLKRNAYDTDQLDFLRVLASYTAIALSNSIAHGELAFAHRVMQETQQQLVLQEKMAGLGTLTAGVAHEINNPTNFVHVAAQIQRTEIADFRKFLFALVEEDDTSGVLEAFDERFKKLDNNIGIMLTGTERIKGIVKDLRAFSRLDEAEKKSIHLSECLNSTLNLVRTVWLERIEFVTEFDDDPELECWPALLNQVFMNLLINGCQAIAERQEKSLLKFEGKLRIRLQANQQEHTIAISFEDNGIGIDAAVQKRILEPFYTTKAVGSGTGLGLSIAFGIIQKHGGSLTFSSELGAGSAFVVTLPLANKPLLGSTHTN